MSGHPADPASEVAPPVSAHLLAAARTPTAVTSRAPVRQACINVPSGEVAGYFRLVPDPESPIAPKVTADDATRIAREDVGNPDAEVLRGPEPRQAKGKLIWALRIAWVDPWGKDSRKLYIIDAVTGDIVTTAVPK